MQNCEYSYPPYNHGGGYIPRPLWVLETTERTKPYVDHVFLHTYVPMIKINLRTRHNLRLTITANIKIEQL